MKFFDTENLQLIQSDSSREFSHSTLFPLSRHLHVHTAIAWPCRQCYRRWIPISISRVKTSISSQGCFIQTNLRVFFRAVKSIYLKLTLSVTPSLCCQFNPVHASWLNPLSRSSASSLSSNSRSLEVLNEQSLLLFLIFSCLIY